MKSYLDVMKALSDESRVRIVKMLEQGEACVCQIQSVIGLGQSTVSRHLSVLKNAGLVEIRKDGLWVYHRLVEAPEKDVAAAMLGNLSKWLNDETLIKDDLDRLREVKARPLGELCTTSSK